LTLTRAENLVTPVTSTHNVVERASVLNSKQSRHLVAICLQTGRSKDRERVRILREQAKLDQNFLADVLRRHQLEDKWKLWTE